MIFNLKESRVTKVLFGYPRFFICRVLNNIKLFTIFAHLVY